MKFRQKFGSFLKTIQTYQKIKGYGQYLPIAKIYARYDFIFFISFLILKKYLLVIAEIGDGSLCVVRDSVGKVGRGQGAVQGLLPGQVTQARWAPRTIPKQGTI